MNKSYLTIIIVLALIILSGYYFLNNGNTVNKPVLTEDDMKTYSSAEFGLSFKYPKNYLLTEKNTGNGERVRHNIMMVEDTQENRDVLAGKSPGREGPIAITIDIYQNNLDKYTAEKWIRDTGFSNFKQSDGRIFATILDGKEAIQYKWSGLFEADNVVLATEKYVYSVAVTYIAPEDQIRKDFLKVLGSMDIE